LKPDDTTFMPSLRITETGPTDAGASDATNRDSGDDSDALSSLGVGVDGTMASSVEVDVGVDS